MAHYTASMWQRWESRGRWVHEILPQVLSSVPALTLSSAHMTGEKIGSKLSSSVGPEAQLRSVWQGWGWGTLHAWEVGLGRAAVGPASCWPLSPGRRTAWGWAPLCHKAVREPAGDHVGQSGWRPDASPEGTRGRVQV